LEEGIREDGSYFAIKTRGRKQDGEPERERERGKNCEMVKRLKSEE